MVVIEKDNAYVGFEDIHIFFGEQLNLENYISLFHNRILTHTLLMRERKLAYVASVMVIYNFENWNMNEIDFENCMFIYMCRINSFILPLFIKLFPHSHFHISFQIVIYVPHVVYKLRISFVIIIFIFEK
jgi:hypothetical protein